VGSIVADEYPPGPPCLVVAAAVSTRIDAPLIID
jgi:hypothetical protein